MQTGRKNVIHRILEKTILEANKTFGVLVLTGARQVGKTTLLKKLAPASRTYVTLDNPIDLALAQEDPPTFFKRFPPPVIIDEIQYAPNLLPYIKILVDESGKKGQFWLTGSQQFHLMRSVSESLAGRAAILTLLGMSQSEIAGQGEKSTPFLPKSVIPTPAKKSTRSDPTISVFHRIWRGSFPAIALYPKMDRELFFSSYLKTYLQRDIRDLARVGDEMVFLKFLRMVAARTGQMVNLSEISREAGIALNTVKNWLSILETSGILYFLPPFFSNINKRLVKAPKLYFLDTGLCAYLTSWPDSKTLEAGAMAGSIFETFIVGELLKSYWHHGRQPPFYYYRDKDQKEVDLLIHEAGTLYPIEIKKTASPAKEHVSHFKTLENLKIPLGPGTLICTVDRWHPLTATVNAIPPMGI